jgi:hypothetical protein
MRLPGAQRDFFFQVFGALTPTIAELLALVRATGAISVTPSLFVEQVRPA